MINEDKNFYEGVLLKVILMISMLTLVSCLGEPEVKQLEAGEVWVEAVRLSFDSESSYVGETKDYIVFSSSENRKIEAVKNINIGDTVEGVKIEAIKCSEGYDDLSYQGKQYMWKGRWNCMLGSSKKSVLNAVSSDGNKNTNYIHIAPVDL